MLRNGPNDQGGTALQERENQHGVAAQAFCSQWQAAFLLQRRGELGVIVCPRERSRFCSCVCSSSDLCGVDV